MTAVHGLRTVAHLCEGVYNKHVHVQEDNVPLVCHALRHQPLHESDLHRAANSRGQDHCSEGACYALPNVRDAACLPCRQGCLGESLASTYCDPGLVIACAPRQMGTLHFHWARVYCALKSCSAHLSQVLVVVGVGIAAELGAVNRVPEQTHALW